MDQNLLEKLLDRKSLTREEMQELMNRIMSGEMTDAQIAGFLAALRSKGETKEEIVGCAHVLRQKSLHVSVDDPDAIDTCGTGGDGKHTFNVSTLAALVACAAGVTVVKHGNRSVSSKCGSADVLHHLGVAIHLNEGQAARCIEESGIAFLFAPNFHPAMKHVMTARKELGVRTIFNILGPLANPGRVSKQVMGVFDPELTDVLAEVLLELGLTHAMVVHGMDGLDEISITGATKISELKNKTIRTYYVEPEDFGMIKGSMEDIQGGTPIENGAIMLSLLQGKKSPLRNMVLLNSAAAIYVSGKAPSMMEGLSMARRVMDDGTAFAKLEAFRSASQRAASTGGRHDS